MKRLTEYIIPETGFSMVSEEKYKRIMMEEKPSVEKVYNRLKKIEDILGDEYDLEKLKELVQAKREGRCVVSLCKVGDTVYAFSQMHDKRILPFIKEYEVTSIRINKRSLSYYHEKDGFIKIMKQSDFGKTFFLTYTDAEAALRREQDG